MNISKIYSPRRMMRMQIVAVIYQYELENLKIDANKIYEENKLDGLFTNGNKSSILNEQMKIIKTLEKNYDSLVNLNKKFIRSDWKWERLNPLLRSLLLCSAIELWKLDTKIVANEYVEIAKDFFPNSNEYKYVNIVIEKIGEIYNEHKKNN